MKTMNIDTVIIGAGPSGISAGITLQKANISNIVIDRQKFPREKPCGGLVTKKSLRTLMKLLDVKKYNDIKDVFCNSSNIVELYHRDTRLTHSKVQQKLHFVKRESFDYYLVEKYRKMGGTLFENEKSYKISFYKKEIVLSNGNIINYKNLIVADGALSSTRDKLGYNKPKLGFCIEAFIPKKDVSFRNAVRIYFGVIDNGYAWVFPYGDEYCIGMGGVYSTEIKYIKRFEKYLKMLGVPQKKYKTRGGFVPYGEIVGQTDYMNNEIVLTGDAGGLVDPIYGEGIYFALSSGILAARARIESDNNFKNSYLKKLTPYTNIIKQGARVQKFFFNKYVQKLFKRKAYKKNKFVTFYCDNQVSEYKYPYKDLLKMYIGYKKWKKGLKNVDLQNI